MIEFAHVFLKGIQNIRSGLEAAALVQAPASLALQAALHYLDDRSMTSMGWAREWRAGSIT